MIHTLIMTNKTDILKIKMDTMIMTIMKDMLKRKMDTMIMTIMKDMHMVNSIHTFG